MKEKDFQTKFTRWLHYRYEGCGAFELKITHEKSLPFRALQDHQAAALVAVKHGGIEYKIPDDTIGSKPFDCFRLVGPAFVIVMFYKHGCRTFYAIDIDDWLREVNVSTRKSLIETRAAEIGTTHQFA